MANPSTAKITRRLFSGTPGASGQTTPDLNFTEFQARAKAKLDAITVTAKIKGDEGNVKKGSYPISMLDLVLNMNPNADGGNFKPEVYQDFSVR